MKKIIGISILMITSSIFSQGTITGAVTYLFNEYQGVKPDLAAKVAVLDSLTVKDFDFNMYEKYERAKTLKNRLERWNIVYESASRSDQKDYKIQIDAIQNELKKLDSDTDEKFDTLDKIVRKKIVDRASEEKMTLKIIDNSGGYSLTVSPGTYYIFITSKNVHSSTLSEIDGDIYCEKVKITGNQTKEVSYNFKS